MNKDFDAVVAEINERYGKRVVEDETPISFTSARDVRDGRIVTERMCDEAISRLQRRAFTIPDEK